MQQSVPWSIGLAVLLGGVVAGCASHNTPANPPPSVGGQPVGSTQPYPSPYGSTYPQGYPPPAGGAAAGAPSGSPSAPAGSGAGGASTATPLDPTAAAAAGLALAPLATSSAPGMSKEGAPLAGSFQEGQTLSQPITLEPGKCYTFLAAGIGPTELEIQLVAATPFPGLAPVLGDQKGEGGHVVLGAGASCVKLALIPVPVQANWIVKATRGGGVVAGQAYSK